MADVLTAEQEEAAKAFVEIVNRLRKRRAIGPLSWSSALKFLIARKFDVQRAVTLYEQHEITRHREGLVNFDINKEPLRSELLTGKFTILPTRDGTGAAIALFRARMHSPVQTSHQTTLQGIVYQLDVALENSDTQKHGIVFIYDMSDSKYSNFDYDLSQKILTLLKGGYPAKLKKVLIVTAPLWFKAPFKILRLFVREKLRDRVYTISIPQLPIHIPRQSLPITLGGELQVDHLAWLQFCSASMTNRHEEDPPPIITTPVDSEQPKIENSLPEPEPPEKHPRLCGSPGEPSSSASSGFSDDDSLHCDVGHPALTIQQFVEHVRSKGRRGLVEEYSEIKQRPPDGSFNNAKMRHNQTKNRYSDVLCFDHSRVLLSPENNDSTTDYINANYVDGYKQRNAFICTQGPLPKTAQDFWRMVWEQQCLIIVMTTKVVERAKTKCHQYWELDIDGVCNYGNFQICTKEVDAGPAYTVSVLELVNVKTEERREVMHFQFTSWPDYGNPHSSVALLDFLNRVRSTQRQMVSQLGDTWAGHPKGPPIVVHCSAGIGRTGTFCTIDISIQRLEDAGTVDVRGTVERIRSQRAYSIQMPDQYMFCHLALIEHAMATNLIPPVDLTQLEITEDDAD